MGDYNRTVYFDMDGVLADFEGGFYKISGTTVDDITDEEMWASIGSYGKAKFFSELEWMAGGKEIWQFALDNFPKVKILSALGRSDKIDKQTTQGKLMWIRHNIPSLQLDDIILVDNKHRKRHYCKPGDIIIDDTPVVIDEWTKKGGIGIFHKTAAETIAKLKQYVEIMKESKQDVTTGVIPREKLKGLVKKILETITPPEQPDLPKFPKIMSFGPDYWKVKKKKPYVKKPTPTGMARIKKLGLEKFHDKAIMIANMKPKQTSYWFSTRMDKDNWPFFRNPDSWTLWMFLKDTYLGPDLKEFGFDMKTGDMVDTHTSLWTREAPTHMKEWNKAIEKRAMKQWPGEYTEWPDEDDIDIKEFMKLSEIKKTIDEVVGEVLKEVNYTTDDSGKHVIAVGAPGSLARFAVEHPLKSQDFEGPYTVDVKKGRLAGQTVFASKHKKTGFFYYLNPDTGTDEFIGDENSVNVKKQQEEGVGYVHAKDRAKDPKSIKTDGGTEHWRIKFQSASDLKKHGNTEKSKVDEGYETFVKGQSGDLAGKTPTDEKELRDMIANMTPGQSILFYGQSGIRGPMISITRLSGKDSYEVEDEKKKKQKINNYSQIDHLAKIVSQKSNILSRVWVRNQTTQQLPADNQITKEELKEVIKELINEMWVDIGMTSGNKPTSKKPTGRGTEAGADANLVALYKGSRVSENQDYQDYMDRYVGEECPACGNRDVSVLNPSNPSIYQCRKCSHKWNPDNEKSTILKKESGKM